MLTSSSSSRVILTIAGFDPSGGAGLIADIRTIVSFGCMPVAAVTSLTFQNSEGVWGAIHQTAESLRAQISSVVKEFQVAAVKTGMLPTRESVIEVVRFVQEKKIPAPVVDPVLRSSSGYELMEAEAREALVAELISLARLITPNIPEAEVLTGIKIENEADMCEAARRLREMGARSVLVKGGHLNQKSGAGPGHQAIDVLDDEGHVTVFRSEWIASGAGRGTGCMLSAGIAACLGQGMDLPASVNAAKRFVAEAIRYAPALGPDPVTLQLTEMTRLEK